MKRLLLASAVLFLAACGVSDPFNGSAAAKADAPTTTKNKARVVVADLDTAFNPYHSFFYEDTGNPLLEGTLYPKGSPPSSVTPEVLKEFGIDKDHILSVTRTGFFSKDLEADAALWAKVKKGEVYWFKGTNVLAVSYAGDSLPPLKPITDKNQHGTGTSSSVLSANPEAIVVFVESWDTLGGQAPHEFGFRHPSVDIITTSYGYGVGIPGVGGTGLFPPEPNAFFSSFMGVVKLGKLHFSSGGNMPGSTPHRGGAGPWWSIGVSGIEEGSSEGRTLTSGDFPDFVADFTQDIPYCLNCETGLGKGIAGTSFSTPRAAGVASKLLLDLRRELGHVGGIHLVNDVPVMAEGKGQTYTNWQIRRALEEAAHVPVMAAPQDALLDLALPINQQAPWLQAGWGEISADAVKNVVPEAMAVLGFGERQSTKAAGFCDFQTQIIQERHLYWDNVSPISDMVYDDTVWPVLGPALAMLVDTVPAPAKDYVAYATGYFDLRGDPSEAVADPFIYCGSALPAPPAP